MPYPSDVSDAQWALVGPFLQAWRARRVSVAGQHGQQDLREVVNAILYQSRTVVSGRICRRNPRRTTSRCVGTDATIHELLHCQTRQKAGRAEDLSMVVLDTQSVRAANHVPAATTGKDAGKKVPGRKRGWPWTPSR